MTPRKKDGSGVEEERKIRQGEAELKICLVVVRRKEGVTFSGVEWKMPMLRSVIQFDQNSVYDFFSCRSRRRSDGQIVGKEREPNYNSKKGWKMIIEKK